MPGALTLAPCPDDVLLKSDRFRDFVLPVLVIGAIVAGGLVLREMLRSEPPMPSEWLTEVQQERLADRLSTVRPGRWVAACVFHERDRGDIDDVVDAPGDGEVRYPSAADEDDVSFLVVEDVHVPFPVESYDEIEAPGAFCYVPGVTARDRQRAEDGSRLVHRPAWHAGCLSEPLADYLLVSDPKTRSSALTAPPRPCRRVGSGSAWIGWRD